MDGNRFDDGIELRNEFMSDKDIEDPEALSFFNQKPCSMLEMMVALASRFEDMMWDPDYGDRTSKWFWNMMNNLGLIWYNDYIYDDREVSKIISSFLGHHYEKDGKGGLFYVKGSDKDFTDAELWSQMCWYMESIY